MDLFDRIRQCLIDLDKECVFNSIDEALKQGYNAVDIVLGPLSKGMEEIGRLFEEGEYFIAELIEAAEIFKGAMKKLEERLKAEASRIGGGRGLTIVIGTVKGDIHDIGKMLVAVMLQAAGHNVIDLGVDVDAEKFIDAIIRYDADVLGMSALLTTTAKYMGEVIRELERRGLRNKVFVIIGGAATSKEFAEKIGADAWAKDAVEAVKIINKLALEKRRS